MNAHDRPQCGHVLPQNRHHSWWVRLLGGGVEFIVGCDAPRSSTGFDQSHHKQFQPQIDCDQGWNPDLSIGGGVWI